MNFNCELARREQEDRVRDVWHATRVPCKEHAVCHGERRLSQRVEHVAKPLAQPNRQESHGGESLICSLTIDIRVQQGLAITGLIRET